MDKNNTYVLIHSPLVGPLTWKLVAEQLQQRGIEAVVPTLIDSPEAKEPFWKQHAQSAAAQIPKHNSIILVAHSGTGPLLPAIRAALTNPVHAYVFVDAGIPRNGVSRLDLMRSEDPQWAMQFQENLERGGTYPKWSFDDLQEVLPDESLRGQMIAEIQPRGVTFFTEPIPVFEGWPDAPCAYIRCSAAYERPAMQARAEGWPTYELEAGHFHMLVDAATVTDLILEALKKLDGKD